ncbi:MAG: acyl-CoA dehydrogenase family protein [Acidimicrobiales bacterium]
MHFPQRAGPPRRRARRNGRIDDPLDPSAARQRPRRSSRSCAGTPCGCSRPTASLRRRPPWSPSCTGPPGTATSGSWRWTCWGRALLGEQEPGYELTALKRLFLFTRSDTIYAGSNQIQRNIIGERALGLPKEPTV